ncbi:MAG: hemK1 [Steroidobacteraceae bacterium]|nr:hemK1 [Steroidobacteraceae bacterium]
MRPGALDHAIAVVHWHEGGKECEARWLSHGDTKPPTRVVVADGKMKADEAYGLACQGTALLWRGDFQEARQMLNALGKRADRPRRKSRSTTSVPSGDPGEAFHLHRQARSQRARTMNALLIPLDADYSIPLQRAPDIRQACAEAWGPAQGESVAPLRALLGVIGAHEWQTKGIEIPEDSSSVAFDIGTGTGVLAAVLARRGIQRVVATDLEPRALACASDNIQQLGLASHVDVVAADLFPEGRAALVVCNPPWIPARPSSPMENGIYDPDSRMLRGFLAKLPSHLVPGGEGWLILSDLAEHLGLRTRAQLLAEFDAAGLRVVARNDVPPRHPKAADASDPLHAARAAEVTSLWRLVAI